MQVHENLPIDLTNTFWFSFRFGLKSCVSVSLAFVILWTFSVWVKV